MRNRIGCRLGFVRNSLNCVGLTLRARKIWRHEVAKLLDDQGSMKLDYFVSVIGQILGTLDAGFSMSSMILSCCCIDYLSLALSANFKNTNSDFKKFMSDYMSAANPKYFDASIQDSIYAIRCSLVHTYGGSDATNKLSLNPVFEINPFPSHLEKIKEEDGTELFHISIPHFVAEVVTGCEKFFRENTDVAKLEQWYKNLIVINGFQGNFLKLGYLANGRRIIHSQIHPFLASLDGNFSDYKMISDLIVEAFLKAHNYWIGIE